MIDIRKLHQQQEESELQQQHIYEKILYKCHHRIITVSKKGETFCFFVVPEFEFGMPRYHPLKCCRFIIKRMTENGFLIRYTHPNLLYISWDKKYLDMNRVGRGITNGEFTNNSTKQITAPKPAPLPPTQHTMDYRPSGRLSSVVSGGSMGGGGSKIGNGGISRMGGGGSSIATDYLTKPLHSSSGGSGGSGGSVNNFKLDTNSSSISSHNSQLPKKNISWDPTIPTSSSSGSGSSNLSSHGSHNSNNINVSVGNNNRKNGTSSFDASQDLLGGLDVVDIKF